MADDENEIITLLLADAEDTSSIWVDEPALMHRLMALHHAIFSAAVKHAGGTVFEAGGDL